MMTEMNDSIRSWILFPFGMFFLVISASERASWALQDFLFFLFFYNIALRRVGSLAFTFKRECMGQAMTHYTPEQEGCTGGTCYQSTLLSAYWRVSFCSFLLPDSSIYGLSISFVTGREEKDIQPRTLGPLSPAIPMLFFFH